MDGLTSVGIGRACQQKSASKNHGNCTFRRRRFLRTLRGDCSHDQPRPRASDAVGVRLRGARCAGSPASADVASTASGQPSTVNQQPGGVWEVNVAPMGRELAEDHAPSKAGRRKGSKKQEQLGTSGGLVSTQL